MIRICGSSYKDDIKMKPDAGTPLYLTRGRKKEFSKSMSSCNFRICS
ncbi:hypothetical protein LEP1GSC082_2676 [Leptospira kirschneri str. H2]|uniref:Uncharacterized protein n=1 Tax=Leptospira kirschneri str. H1 TaxID=1049966 RepID=A0A0E2AZ88_9LEPT|nr:hypothetical protein LEP1GSC081_0819 [Leptospira kirschneri str. H1]EKO15099.1 hypothetical protein LEP1GSC081_4400 [Leptospira kirschneri str. H1]EKO60635.1 hypothetical protein LEP1GSC082_2676 [Leptospira kirschneri str. H2]